MKLSRLFLFSGALAIGAACSSGGTAVTPSSTAAAGGQGSTPVLNLTISFSVAIPPAPPAQPAGEIVHKKSAQTTVYISPNTGSIGIRLVAVNGISLAQPPPAGPASNVPTACRGSASGCHVSVPGVVAAVGTDTYTVTTFAGANGEGAVVSTGIVTVTVKNSGVVSTIGGDPTQLALGGYVASLSLTVAPAAFTFGVPAKASIVVTPKDGAGATIVGNAQFAFPIVLSIAGSGFALSGPGLQPDGTIQLTQPQAASPPIVLSYDGTGSAVTVNATSQNGAGAPVAAPPVVITVPTPTAAPTSSAITTLPPISPSPIITGPTPIPTAAPSSVYVVNAYDNSIFEFNEPLKGKYSEYPRRGFGGSSLTSCYTPYSLLGIASDPSANVYVGSPGEIFGECSLQLYAFPPSFSGPGAPPPAPISFPGAGSEADAVFQLAFDAPNGGKLDFSDDSLTIFVARVAAGGGKANPTLGYPIKPSANEACFISTGLPNPDPTCAFDGDLSFFDESNNINRNAPFAVGPDGSLYVAAYDAFTGYEPAIIKVTPSNQISAGTIVAEPAWIEGSSTLMSFPVALAYDAARNSLWVYDAGNATAGNSSPSTPPPMAGPGAYLLEFPLTAFGGVPGPQNAAPAAFLSGQTISRFATASAPTSPLNLITIQPNAITVPTATSLWPIKSDRTTACSRRRRRYPTTAKSTFSATA